MLLKELLQNIKIIKGANDFITLNYYDKGNVNKPCPLSYSPAHIDYAECDVVEYKIYNTEWVDPFSNAKGTCKQYAITIDWDEIRIINEQKRVERLKKKSINK